MWVIHPSFFLSIVDKDPTGQGRLCVRARVGNDLRRFRDFCPELSPNERHEATDYQFRAYATREQVAAAVAKVALDIDYANMKAETERRLGLHRELVYTRAWSALLGLVPLPRRRGRLFPPIGFSIDRDRLFNLDPDLRPR